MPALELARAIADAVLACRDVPRHASSLYDLPTQAVLQVLEERQLWFQTYDVTDDGIWIGGTERRIL